MSSFTNFGFNQTINSNLSANNLITPTPIQDQAIPQVLAGKDVVGLAQTGTGKTAAFILPILEVLYSRECKSPRALIIAPTRELAEQIYEVTLTLSKGLNIKAVSIYGGVSINPQIASLKRGVDIVIACPGRLLDHMQQRTIDLSKVELLVLDEADHMFDMGFLPNIKRIVKALPKERQTLLFSATMPPDIKKLAMEILRSPITVNVNIDRPTSTVSHAIYPIDQERKTGLLYKILENTDKKSVLIFTKTKHRAKKLALQLEGKSYEVASLQGNLSQNRRQDAINGFKSGKYQLLVATDIAARGIDIASVSHVINYDMPDTVEAYTHRIGRTGRAQRTGDAYTFVTHEDNYMIREIERVLGAPLERRQVEGVAEMKIEVLRDDRPPFNSNRPRKGQGSNQRNAPQRRDSQGQSRDNRGGGGGQARNGQSRSGGGGFNSRQRDGQRGRSMAG